MTKISIAFFIFVSCCFPSVAERSYLKYYSVEYPKEILIPRNFNRNEFTVKYGIRYSFHGDSIVSSDEKYDWSIHSKSPIIMGRIIFIDKRGNILPKAFNFFRYDLTGNIIYTDDLCVENDARKIFLKDELNIIELDLLSPIIFKETDIAEAIENKTLTKILINIDIVKINWSLTLRMYKEQNNPFEPSFVDTEKKGVFEFKINKKIKIKIKYEK